MKRLLFNRQPVIILLIRHA